MMLTHVVRKVVLASLVSLAAGVWGTANADMLTDLGPIPVGPPTPFQGSVLPAGPFTDVFTFVLPDNLGSGYSVLNFPLSIPGVGSFNTLFTTLSLVSNPDGILYNGDDSNLANVTAPSNATSLKLSFGPTSGGNMYLVVTGLTNGTLGGLYSGAISVTPIPEPTVWAMMLGGLGLLGWVRLRSKAYLR